MKGSIETTIRLKAVIIYLIVALVCFGIVTFIYKFRTNLDDQKANVEQYSNELTLANDLVLSVNNTQTEINSYAATRKTSHYNQYRRHLKSVDQQIDTLKSIVRDSSQHQKLTEISSLLRMKGNIIARLNKQFTNENPLDTITQVLSEFVPSQRKDSFIITTTKQDTITKAPPKKGFWRRLADAFSPKDPDTLETVTVVNRELVIIPDEDSTQTLPEIKDFAEQASSNYQQRIQTIEKHVRELIVADQQISSQISKLLIDFYSETVISRLIEIQKSEAFIRQNNTYSIAGGVIALLLILIFIILIISDVNKGYRARKTLEEANERIKQVMESRHQLLLSVSHDIKTPLNSILGYLELSKKDQPLSGQVIHSMQNSGKHILALLNNLLNFSSIEQGTLQITQTKFNLNELCKDTVEMFEPLARQKDLQFIYNFDFDKGLSLCSDALKIKQILINLLSNAIKYTTDGGVLFNTACSDDQLRFEITDTGVGIPEDQIETIYQAFTRVESDSSLAEGSGFGMFVVKGLLERLNGKIKIHSARKKGTRIKVTIPVTDIEIVKESESKGKRILVVDDDQPFLSMIQEMLIRLGHFPTYCDNLQQFEKELERGDFFDSILTDMEMGHFTGTDVLTRVQQKGLKLPVYIMSARIGFNLDAMKELGFADCISKPVTLYSLKQLFGGTTDEASPSFGLLSEMLGDDPEAIREILELFCTSSTENIQKLRQTIETDNFNEAQAICHKMLSMFMQIGDEESTVILKRMDLSRKEGAGAFPNWKEKISELIEQTEQLVRQIKARLASV